MLDAQAERTPLNHVDIVYADPDAGAGRLSRTEMWETGPKRPSARSWRAPCTHSSVREAGLAFGLLARRIGVRVGLGMAAMFLGASAIAMLGIATPLHGYLAACCFGLGIGGLLTVLPLAWADYFGRASFGAIRGAALTVQVTAQASGPLLSGLLRDLTGNYAASLVCFAVLSFVGALVALLARAPEPPHRTARMP